MWSYTSSSSVVDNARSPMRNATAARAAFARLCSLSLSLLLFQDRWTQTTPELSARLGLKSWPVNEPFLYFCRVFCAASGDRANRSPFTSSFQWPLDAGFRATLNAWIAAVAVQRGSMHTTRNEKGRRGPRERYSRVVFRSSVVGTRKIHTHIALSYRNAQTATNGFAAALFETDLIVSGVVRLCA